MLLIGIDEAGYGPLLGPLCHGFAALRVADTAQAPCMWTRLAPRISRHPAPAGSVAVDDSKRLHAAGGAALLVRGLRAFGAGTQLEVLLPREDLADLERDAWGRAAPGDVVVPEEAQGGTRADGEASSTGCVALGARALSVRAFNARLGSGDNKAEINFSRVREILAALLNEQRDGEPAVVVVDRLGGRKFYREGLQSLAPETLVWVERETAEVSEYYLERRGAVVRIAFRVGAEAQALPVALASMAAKLARELCMARFNAYFQSHQPGLAPTAGYTTDARRFLKETDALRRVLGVDDGALVRDK